MLSRLKGIETNLSGSVQSVQCVWICFPVWRELKLISGGSTTLTVEVWICFPVWRELKRYLDVLIFCVVGFGYAFPFEGNWNKCFDHLRTSSSYGLDMLSRLKGIETITRPGQRLGWRGLDMLSRLKGIETWCRGSCCRCRSSLDMLSRLKGIETLSCSRRHHGHHKFGYAFPFEGNWNSAWSPAKPLSFQMFGYAFPFEGNWNFLRVDIFARALRGFGYAFPFEGNWNNSCLRVAGTLMFGYAFPFEGNWNKQRTHNNVRRKRLDMLSRLKGIETLFVVVIGGLWMLVWICFPVWRELKLQASKWHL